MTLTSPNCPVESLPREVEEKVKSIEHKRRWSRNHFWSAMQRLNEWRSKIRID
jgi:metal-sulfur cluster biosynthetic enzyme